MKRFKTVDDYISGHKGQQTKLEELRKLLNSTELTETVKWGGPVYTIKGKNVVGYGVFKDFISIWFFQGALLKDPNGKLINAQESVTQAMRQWRMGFEEELDRDLLLQYVQEAIENQKEGKQVEIRRKKPLEVPPELLEIFEKDTELEKAFGELNLTKKREFAEYISTAKRMPTKLSRLEKIRPMIKQGIGLNDKYR